MQKNLIKEKILNEEKTYGTLLTLNSIWVSEIISNVGFDFFFIDMEHGMMSFEKAGSMIMGAKSSNTVPLIRVSQNDHVEIGKALDAGALGVMVPMIMNKKDAENAVEAFKYPPYGNRGLGPGHVSLHGINLKEYIKSANDEVLTILQIEHIEAINNIEEITEVKGIDVIFVGPSDLASSMGLIGDVSNPLVQEKIDIVREVCMRKNINLGIFCSLAEDVSRRAEQGYKLIAHGTDALFLMNGARQALSSFNKI